MRTPIRFKPYKEILTPQQILEIEEPARRLYSTAFNSMEFFGAEAVSMANDAAVARAKIRPEQLEEAQQQLTAARLMQVEMINSSSSRYTFLADSGTH
jgi:hypothetical protein